MTPAQLAEIFKKIARLYPNFQADKSKFDDWYDLLKDIPADEIAANLTRHASSSRYIPTPAELIGPERDQQTTNHEAAWRETQQRLAEMEGWRINAAPPPPDLRERVFGHAAR